MRLAELLFPLAVAADECAALPPDTTLRTALIALRFGATLGLPRQTQSDLMYAALLRHSGCSATAHEETQLMGDERLWRRSLLGAQHRSALELIEHAGRALGYGRVRRAGFVLASIPRARRSVSNIFRTRCEVSARFARRLGLSEDSVEALLQGYERFDGKGVLGHSSRATSSPLGAILTLAEQIALRIPNAEREILPILEARAGGQFDPELVQTWASKHDAILEQARSPTYAALLNAEPQPWRGAHDPRAAAFVLADFVDLKSVFTLGHSRHVANIASRAAAILKLTSPEIESLELAGLVHDLGKVCVSNAIWDKPGPLDPGEWSKVYAHPELTLRALASGAPFAELGRLAASDHERMDATGYPTRTRPTNSARILAAADVVRALTEVRAHRPAHTLGSAAKVALQEALSGHLDRAVLNSVLEAAAQRGATVSAPRGLGERELELLSFVARGHAHDVIASQRRISPRLARDEVQALLQKLKISTRGAAALVASEHALL